MDEPTECGQIADLLAEMATGAVSGPDRARVMRHLTICDACWDELTDLSKVADEVLLAAAPEHEPRAGFESAVLDRIEALTPAVNQPQRTSASRTRRVATYVLAAAVAGLGGAGVVWQVTADDRDIAASYRETLDVADGRYFTAEDLVDASGTSVGTVFMYEGTPSWLFVIVRDAPDGTFEVEVDTDDGPVDAGQCVVSNGTGSCGATIDAHIYDIEAITLRSPTGEVLVAVHDTGSG